MKIALIQSFLPSRSQGGVGHFTHQFANRLAARGHGVWVYSLDPAPDGARYTVVSPAPGVPYLSGKLGRTYGFALWLAAHRFTHVDVVHALGDNHGLRTRRPVVRTLSGAAAAEAWHAARITTKAFFASIYPLELVGAARATRAVGISRATLTHFPFVKAVIPQGVDTDVFRPGEDRSGAPSILFVGHRLHDRKRADLLLRAFGATVRPALPEAELWLVCDDAVEAPGVRCHANLPLDALAALYRRAWVFCLPSSYEGFGRPYIEAMASGTPVVATPNVGATEVLDHGRFGVLAAPDRLGQALLDLLRDAPRREALAQAGLARAQSFRWAVIVEQYEALYREAIAAAS